MPTPTSLKSLKQIFACIDNTSLSSSDTHQSIEQLCETSMRMQSAPRGIDHVAAVCVFPVFVQFSKQILKGSGIKVASVAGAFPTGQSPIDVKLQEVQYALDEGADEIDMVISIGSFLEGDYHKVADEIAAIKALCGTSNLKVIIETGALQTVDNIYKASMLSMESGADFIKTSTGKIPVGATLEAAQTMLQAIHDYGEKSGKQIGFKVAGGVSTPQQALDYYQLVKKIMGTEYITNQKFRVGASHLTERLFRFLTL